MAKVGMMPTKWRTTRLRHRVLLLFLTLLIPGWLSAQTTSVSATITDSGGQAWFNGTYTFTFRPSNDNPNAQYRQGGVPFDKNKTISGALDGTGSLTAIGIPDNNTITPGGSTWTVQVCSAATFPCFSISLTITGASQNITAQVIPPAVSISLINPTSVNMKAYSDSEITSAVVGSTYYNLVSQVFRFCQVATANQVCTVWAVTGTGAGGAAAGTPVQMQVNAGGGPPNVFGGTNCTTLDAFPSTTEERHDCNTHFKGPNPYVDIARYGARVCIRTNTPCEVGLTATATASSTSVTISNASSFVNGDGVVIYGAGPTQSMTTPSAPAITPSVAFSGTGTGLTVASTAGSNTRCYKVIARDKNGGLTAASSETCTSQGQTLGVNIVNITSSTRSGQTVTVTLASAHNFVPGCSSNTCGEVFIAGSPTDATIQGWYIVNSVSDSTHFTFLSEASTATDAPASSTGGTAEWFACNHVTWSAVTGAWQYYIYAGSSGAETLAGVSRPQGALVTDTTWDDFGSPMMSNFNFPPYVPTNPPGAATSDHLSTTIVSGAGTTSLVLANAAGTSIAGATIRLDAAPAIKAAASAINTGGPYAGTLYIPADNSGTGAEFVVNSFLDLTPYIFVISQSGPLALNETMAVVNDNSGFAWYGDRQPQFGNTGNGVGPSPHTAVDVNTANPGAYFSTTFYVDVEGLTFRTVNSGGNGALLVLVDGGGFKSSWRNLSFVSSTSTNGFMDIGLYFRGRTLQSVTDFILDTVSFAPGSNGIDGSSHTPSFACVQCGSAQLRDIFVSHHGFFWQFPSGGGGLQIGQIHELGGLMPAFTVVGQNGTIRAGNISMDTMNQPCFMVSSTILISLETGLVCSPGLNFPMVSGALQPVQNHPTLGAVAGSGGPANNSQYPIPNTYGFLSNLNSSGVQTSLFGVVGHIAADKNHSLFVSGAFPAAPTCSVVAGGSLPLGNYNFKVAPLWQDNLEGQFSVSSNLCTTTTGNQTINVNWSSVVGNPKGYNLYASQNFGGYAVWAPFNASNPFPPTGPLSFTWSSTTGISSVAGVMTDEAGPTMMMPGVQGVQAPAFVTSAPPSGFTSTSSASSLTANRSVNIPDVSGTQIIGPNNLLISPTSPTIASGFNTSGFSIAANGTASFSIVVGTGAATNTGVLTMPAAAGSWNCWLTNQTRADLIQQTGSTTTSATFTNFGTTFAATNWTNSDILRGGCMAN